MVHPIYWLINTVLNYNSQNNQYGQLVNKILRQTTLRFENKPLPKKIRTEVSQT